MRRDGIPAMLVVTANWGCGDGTLVPSVAGRAEIRRWFAVVHRGIVRAGFRRDGRYRPVDRVDLVFAGDTFDCLTSSAWLAAIRPWHEGRRAQAARAAVAVAAARRAAPLLALVARWMRRGVEVPDADGRARPAARSRARVPVRAAFLAGDRDPWLDEAAAQADLGACRAGRLWCDGDVLVRHGHEFDPACQLERGDRGRPPTLAESIAVDLVAPFAAMLRARGPCGGAAESLVAALAAVGPLGLPGTLAAWLDAAATRGSATAETRAAVIDDWQRAVAGWRRGTDRPCLGGSLPACPLDALASWLERGIRGLHRALRPPVDLQALAGPTPRQLANILAAPGTGVGPAARQAAVLGHPSGGLLPLGGGSRLVCLGAGAERRWGPVAVVDGESARAACVGGTVGTAPVAVAARITAGRMEWVPLGAGVRDGLETVAAVARHEPIVDAA